MRVYNFATDKYDRNIHIDCVRLSDNSSTNADKNPYGSSFHEIVFITSGKGFYKIDNKVYNFNKGDIFFLTPSKVRAIITDKSKFDGYSLIFEELFIANFFNDSLFLYRFHFFYNADYPPLISIKDSNDFKVINAIFENIFKEFRELQNDSHHFIRAQLYYSLIYLNRIFKTANGITKYFFDDPIALKFKKLLEQKNSALFTVADYADAMGINSASLNKTVKKAFGQTAGDVIKQRRIEEAKKLILLSDLNFAEISMQLNYSEPSNFSRNFKRETGLTPQEFKAKFQNE